MALIPLTRGQYAIVDEADLAVLSQWKWHALKQPKTFYAARNVQVDGKKTTVWMHRLINETPDDLFTDHINGNGLDNRRRNLRSVSHHDNMINSARHKAGSSRFRGVSWHISNHRWVAQITHNYRNIYLGAFATEEQAAAAYEAKRRQLRFGKIMRAQESI